MTRNQLRKRLVKIETYNFTASNTRTGETTSIKGLQRDLAFVAKTVLLLERKTPRDGDDVPMEE